jgi:hypothetical protein
MKKQGSCGALPGLGQLLGRQHSQGKSGIDHMIRQCTGNQFAALNDGVESDLLGVCDAGLEGIECTSLVQVRDLNGVTGLPDFVRKSEDTGRAPLGVVE